MPKVLAAALLALALVAGGCARKGDPTASVPEVQEPVPDGIVPLSREIENPAP